MDTYKIKPLLLLSLFAAFLVTPLFMAAPLFLAAPVAQAHESNQHLLEQVINGDHRDPANKARDRYRHPLQTLMFFGVKPDMTVVEIAPGGSGWYMELLAPYLRDNGKYYAASYDQDSVVEYFRSNIKRFNNKVDARPDIYGKIVVTEFAPPKKLAIAPEDSADMVLTFRNVHNWMGGDAAEQAFATFYKTLKPGGILGVVEHRADNGQPQDPKAKSGYVREDYVIELAQAAGFQLLAKSEINSNPKDSKDHVKGVWTLPPSLRGGDGKEEQYRAIGESDRMTLKFVKPE